MNYCILITTLFLILGHVWTAPSDKSFVVSTTTELPTESETNDKEDGGSNNPLEIYEMDISTNVSNRFATTLVTSKVRNKETSAKEASFTVVLPETAFISEFVMEIGGKRYKAYVKEKEEAKQIYNAAVASGQTAAHVSVSARDSNKFAVSINVEPESKAIFFLTYEELLQRKNEQYELVLNIHPGQIVTNLNAQININESRPLKFVRTPSLRSGNEISKNEDKLDPSADIKIINTTGAVVKFNPDAQKQKQFAHDLGTKESDGLSGQFIVQYDVERDPYGGEVLLRDGYFVHFFAPKDLKPLPKHVLFVLDTSGSMGGRKIEQLRDAMKSIMKEIRTGDKVNFIEFNSIVSVWDIISANTTTIQDINYQNPFPELSELNLPAPAVYTEDLLKKSLDVIEEFRATGLTNIIGGLETALFLVKTDQERTDGQNDKKHQPIIIFLTDGDPNVGLSSPDEIVNKVTELNSKYNVPIFSLSFGDYARKDFLRKLSLKNGGFSRHIYEASDASLQLQDFYKQISSPLLSGINFEYESEVTDVTKKVFPIYFQGSELVVTGRYKDPAFPATVKGVGPIGPIVLRPTIEVPVTQLERLWAYITVKQLLEERNSADNNTDLTKKAVDLALKYSFVTDVTSLVVVKPNDTTAVDTEDASKGNTYEDLGSGGRRGFLQFARPFSGYPIPVAQASYPGAASLGGSVHYLSSSKVAVSLDSSRIVGSGFPPMAPALYYTTPLPSLASLPVTTTQQIRLSQDLPWLTSVLNPDETVTIANSSYKLGINYNASNITECPKTPSNNTEPGSCVLLKDCPEVYPLLTDFQTYQGYFCPVDIEYAGICCPKK